MRGRLGVPRWDALALVVTTNASVALAQGGGASAPPLPPGPPPPPAASAAPSTAPPSTAPPSGPPPAGPPTTQSPQGAPPPVYYAAPSGPPPGYPGGQYSGPPIYYAPAPIPEAPRGVHLHDGFYLRMGLGIGRLGAAFKSSDSRDLGGSVEGSSAGVAAAFELAVGGTPAPGLVIGGGLFVSGTGDPSMTDLKVNGRDASKFAQERLSLSLIGPFIDYYFDERSGFHLQGALGIAYMTAGEGTQGGSSVTPQRDLGGLGFMLGGGYEWWVADQWSIGGTLRMIYGATETNRSDDERWTYAGLALPELLFTATYH